MTTPRIFISYSHNAADLPLARYLAARLRELGYDVWQDESSQAAGSDLQDKIDQATRTSDHAIFVVSKLSLQSKWCRLEVDRFDRRDPSTVRRILIFRIPPEQLLLPPAMIGQHGITWLEDDAKHEERFWEVYCALTRTDPGPVERWAEQSRALSKASVPPPTPIAAILSKESLRCDRAVQWHGLFEVAPEKSHDVVFVPGEVGQAHDHFCDRVREMLITVPARSIVSVHWRKRPCTRGEFYEALADDMGVSTEWLPREIAERMVDSNLVLIHPCLRTRYVDPAIISYYVEWLPELIRQAAPRQSVKCVQPVEWPLPSGVVASVLMLFRLRSAAVEDGYAEAAKFIDLIQAGVAPALRAVRLQDLADVSEKDLEEFCQLENLTPPQKVWFLAQIKARAPRTSAEMFSTIDALLPDARSVS